MDFLKDMICKWGIFHGILRTPGALGKSSQLAAGACTRSFCCSATEAKLAALPASRTHTWEMSPWHRQNHRCPFCINRRCHLPSFTFCWFIWDTPSIYQPTSDKRTAMATTVASSPEIFTKRQGVYGISPNGGTGKAPNINRNGDEWSLQPFVTNKHGDSSPRKRGISRHQHSDQTTMTLMVCN